METLAPTSRRHQILEALAHELETSPGSRITTARLAESVGVSEAALYRHFPSKAKMFEGLISFAEESVFGLMRRILNQENDAIRRCEKIMVVLLGFSERNPGITRVLLGEALTGESERLQERVAQFFNRVETQFKQVLREGQAVSQVRQGAKPQVVAGLLVAVAEGKMVHYVRTRFDRSPLEDWSDQWQLMAAALLGSVH